MPTTDASWCAAAWIAIEPQPQPTSSSRAPGRSCEPELAADQLVLGRLGRRSRSVSSVDEPGARVRHRRAEHEPVEVVADVVVVADGGRRRDATECRPPCSRASSGGAGRGGPQQAEQRAAATSRCGERRPARGACRVDDRQHHGEQLVEVAVDVEVAGDVRPGQAELVRSPQEPDERVAGPDLQGPRRGRYLRADAAAVPELDAQRQLPAEQPRGQRADGLGHRQTVGQPHPRQYRATTRTVRSGVSGPRHERRPRTGQAPRSCHVQMHASFPSTSARTHHERANSAVTSVPPAASAAATRCSATSCGTVTSMCSRLR